MSTRRVVINARHWVDHTENIIFSADQVHFNLLQAESSLRRHVFAGTLQDSSLYRQQRQEILKLSNLINQKVSDNLDQTKQWQKIHSLLHTRFEYQSKLLTFQKNFDSNDQLLQTLIEGEVVIQDLLQELEIFRNKTRALLTEHEKQLDSVLGKSMIVGWALLLGSLTSSFSAVYLFRGLDSAHLDQAIELQRNQRMMNAIANSVVDGVITLNSEGRAIQLNRAAKQMLKYNNSSAPYPIELKELIQLQFQDLFIEDQTSPSPRQILETYARRQDGTVFPIEVSVNRTSINNQRLLMIRDITARYQAQQSREKFAQELETLNENLRQSNTALAQRNEELAQFAYFTSHDLKAPLRAITNLSTWIEEDITSQLSAESKKLFQLLRGRANRLEKLIGALAFYVQLGQEPKNLATVNVGALLKNIISKHSKAHTFIFNIQADLPTLKTNKQYLRIIFQELIDNAIQFHPTQTGTIQIQSQEMDDSWTFTVTDDGNGIEPRYHQRIFKVFQTLQSRDQIETTGIGLAIVDKILQLEGGQIAVTSSLGKGASFQFLWPK